MIDGLVSLNQAVKSKVPRHSLSVHCPQSQLSPTRPLYGQRNKIKFRTHYLNYNQNKKIDFLVYGYWWRVQELRGGNHCAGRRQLVGSVRLEAVSAAADRRRRVWTLMAAGTDGL